MSDIVISLMPLLEYQQGRAHLFPSIESMRWFVRKNKAELVQRGALLEIAGRAKVDPTAFDAVVLSAGRRAAGGGAA